MKRTAFVVALISLFTLGMAQEGELEIFSWWAGDEGPALEALIDLYEERHPDVEVINATVTGGAGVNARAVLKTRMLGGDPPDSFQVHVGQELIGTWVAADRMEDLTFLYEEEGWFDVFPDTFIDMLSTEEGIWSVPANLHRSNVMWFVPENLEQWGVEVPTDWDQFVDETCPALQEQGVVPLSVGQNWTVQHLWESIAVAEMGNDDWSALWNREVSFTSDEALSAWETLGDVLECTNEDASGLSWQQATDMVVEGDAAFNVMGDWAAGYLTTTLELDPEEDFGWAPSPGTDGTYMLLADSFGLPQGAPNRDATIEWLRLVGSLEGQDTFNPLKGSISPRQDSDLSQYNAYLQSAAEDFADNDTVGSLVHGVVAKEAFMSEFATAMEIFLSSGNAEQAANAAAAIADQTALGQ